jgi:outer membrane protein assembly factor BamB
LNLSNVNTSQFGLLFKRAVDGYIYAQPLYVPHLIVPPTTTPVNVVYVATMNNSVYAFDADNPAAPAPLWHVSLGPTVPIPLAPQVAPFAGVMSTPVIDTSTNTMYVVAMADVNQARNFQIHALDITTGREKFGGPVLIQARVTGSHGPITFTPNTQFQRPALLLNAGAVWVLFGGGLLETVSYHGWALIYNASTLRQVEAWCGTLNGNGAGIWMSGRGAAADTNGVYLTTGNGSEGPGNTGQSVIRFSGTPQLPADFFLPANYNALNFSDWDLGSGGPILMPGTSLLVQGGKTGVLYVLNRTSLGQLSPGNTRIVQSLQATSGCVGTGSTACAEIHGTSYWARTSLPPLVYVWGRNDILRSFQQATNGSFSRAATNATVSNDPGGIMSVSAEGNANGILWATTTPQNAGAGPVPGTLRALNAETLVELWNSDMRAGDALGTLAKFCIPVVANGKVYMATFSGQLNVYGLTTP